MEALRKNQNELAHIIPQEYLELIKIYNHKKKYGTISLVFQNGKIVGCDITEKRRNSIS